jgi:hypothetical protein
MRIRVRSSRILAVCVFVAVTSGWEAYRPARVFAQSACVPPPVVTINSPQTPTDTCPITNFNVNPIAAFDDYSWRTFISMVWPAANGQRGVPDTTKTVGDSSTPLVFETLKNDWEIFQPNGAAPSSWNAFTGSNPCGSGQMVGFNDMVLASFAKIGDLGQAGSNPQKALIHALPSQNGKWVRYMTVFNQVEYDQIVAGQLYLLPQLQKASPVTFKTGALDIKSSWMDMTGIPSAQAARYYTRQALVLDPANPQNGCSTITVGLVGIHIVQKTPTRPQWIWSTFEQVDNVPVTAGGSGTFGFNDGKGTASPLSPLQIDPNGGFPPTNWASPTVYNVIRLQPINPSTQATNGSYQKALAGTVWQFYQLAMTQWPLQLNPPQPIPASQSGAPGNTFPGVSPVSGFANTTLETWDQGSISTGCMACHNLTKTNTDFLWSLEINAFQATNVSLLTLRKKTGTRPPRSKAERELMALLATTAPKTRAKIKSKP